MSTPLPPDPLTNATDADVLEPDEQELFEHHRIQVDKGQAMLRLDKYLQMRLASPVPRYKPPPKPAACW